MNIGGVATVIPAMDCAVFCSSLDPGIFPHHVNPCAISLQFYYFFFSPLFFVCLFCFFFKTSSPYAAQAGLEPMVLLPLPHQLWDSRPVLLLNLCLEEDPTSLVGESQKSFHFSAFGSLETWDSITN
jgi:hypothetical protein